MIKRIKNFIRNINYLTKHSLWQQRESDIVYLTKKIIDDVGYEFNLIDNKHGLDVFNKEKSFEFLKKNKTSFVRFGDGEINLLKGKDQPFQKYDVAIAKRLFSLLSKPRDDIKICLNYDYFSPFGSMYTCESDYNLRFAFDYRRFFIRNCNPNNTYLDGAVTFWYRLGENSECSRKFWFDWKEFFRDEKIAVICGEGILKKLKYDIFEFAKDIIYIYGPSKHAWSEKDRIILEIEKKCSKEYRLAFILGMAGKAIIPEMVDKGYTAWDIGHLAKGYDLFMKNTFINSSVVGDFFKPD